MTSKRWLAHYDSDVPASIAPYPDTTLLDYLSQLSRQHPSKPALLFKGRTVSYGQLEAESNAFAAALVARGVRKGDRVALPSELPAVPGAEFGAWLRRGRRTQSDLQ
jgi:non-ribosomal peptide synthetase component E (peptide arylation enzyme)